MQSNLIYGLVRKCIIVFFSRIHVKYEKLSFYGLRMSDEGADVSVVRAQSLYHRHFYLLLYYYYIKGRRPTFRCNIFSHFSSEFTGCPNYIISPCLSLLTVNMQDIPHLQ